MVQIGFYFERDCKSVKIWPGR